MKNLVRLTKQPWFVSMQPAYKDIVGFTLLNSSTEGKAALDDFQPICCFSSTSQKRWESTGEDKTRNGKQIRKEQY